MAETTTAADTVTTEWVEEFVDRWISAWNSQQPERVLELMTDDIVYDDSGWPQTMRCHAQVRELLRDALGHSSLVTTDRPGRRGAYPHHRDRAPARMGAVDL